MNKLVLVCIAATGICGQSAIASAAPVNAKPAAYSASGTATKEAQDDSHQFAALQAEIQILQRQVRILQWQDPMENPR